MSCRRKCTDVLVSGDDTPDLGCYTMAHELEQTPLADGIARRAGILSSRYAFAGTPCVRVVAKLLETIAAGVQQPLQCAPAQRICL